MSTTEGAPAPVITPAPITTVPASAPPAADLNPAWLPERLARAEEAGKAKAFADLGITDPTKAKKAIEDAAAAEQEKKSQGEKLGETSKALEAEKLERARLAEVVTSHATRQMGTLTDPQREAVRKLAPDTDPAGQLKAIDALLPTWAAPTAPSAATPPAAPTPPASGTAPTGGPPPGPISQPDHKAEYAALKVKNPHAAALYLNKHQAAIYPPS